MQLGDTDSFVQMYLFVLNIKTHFHTCIWHWPALLLLPRFFQLMKPLLNVCYRTLSHILVCSRPPSFPSTLCMWPGLQWRTTQVSLRLFSSALLSRTDNILSLYFANPTIIAIIHSPETFHSVVDSLVTSLWESKNIPETFKDKTSGPMFGLSALPLRSLWYSVVQTKQVKADILYNYAITE